MENLNLFNNVIKKINDSPFIIAEVGQAHEGSLGNAMSYIDAVADAGVNAVKFQTHFAKEESSKYDDFRVRVFPQDNSRYSYWERMEFSPSEWKQLKDKASDRGLVFLSSPFSILAVKILNKLKIPAWKIASGELSNYPMIDEILNTNLPLLISTGMSSWSEIDEIYKYTASCDRVIFQCTTQYPSTPETLGLNNITIMKSRYPECVIGLSDHSGKIYPSLSAYMLGARIFEVHVAWSKKMFGPDTSSSLDIDSLGQLVKDLKFQYKAISSPIDKDKLRKEKSELHELFGRGIYAKKDIHENSPIKLDDLLFLKPCKGISAKFYKKLLNGKCIKNIKAGEPIYESEISYE